MMGRNHVIIGIGLYLAVDRYLGSGWPEPAIINCLAMTALGSLAPDLDSPRSSLGRKFWPLSFPVKSLVGHRGFTHSLLAILIVFFGLASARQYHYSWFPYCMAFGIGYLSHILADWLTTEGVPLFWPNRKRFRSPLNFKTGGAGEILFSMVAGSLLGVWVFHIFL